MTSHSDDQEQVLDVPTSAEEHLARNSVDDEPQTAVMSHDDAELQDQQSISDELSMSESSSLNTVREPTTAKAGTLHISIPKRSIPQVDHQFDAEKDPQLITEHEADNETIFQEPTISERPASPTSRLSARNLERPSIPHPPVSPTFLPVTAQPGSSWPQHRTSLSSPAPAALHSPIPSPSPRREFFGTQNPFSSDYDESPRSPLQWRQTFEDAVRASSGHASPAAGLLSHTPTPAPAPYEGRTPSRQGSVAPDGYFASRRGSAVNMQRTGSDASASLAVHSGMNGVHLASPSADERRDRISIAFGQVDDADDVPRNGETSHGGPNGQHAKGEDQQLPKEGTVLHGLGLGTPLDSSNDLSEPFESVPLDSSTDLRNIKGTDDDLPPLPLSARSRSFTHRSSLGSNAESLSSSRRVSVSSVASHGQRTMARSPVPRKTSAGLWGDVGAGNTTAARPGSPLVTSNGTANAENTRPLSSNDAVLTESASSSRRPSAAVDDSTPKVAPTPRLKAPPAIPHDVDPALIATLSKPGASSLALAETGDPFTEMSPSSNVAGSRKRRSMFGIRTSTDFVHGSTTADSARTPVSQFAQDHPAGFHPTAGPSMLDQVRSQTRMVHLPPKSREEDQEHLERWKSMMEESRIAEEKRRELMEEKRLAKERRLAEDMPIWEAEILNPAIGSTRDGGDAWSSPIRDNPRLRAMWFRGVPSHLRGKAWSLAIGNDLALSKDSYRQYHSRATRAIQAQRFPQDILQTIEHDAAGTLPVIKIFQPGSPMHNELKDLLCAWYISRLDEGYGYSPDIHHLAGMLLMTMNLPSAFIALRNLLNRPCLRAFYSGVTEEVEAYYRIFENLQGELFPKIYANCKHLGIRLPSSYFTTIFIHQLSFEAATRVWDVIMLEGDSHIFRIALAILAILEPRLYFPDRNEIISILEGTNQASLAIVARERERAARKGLPYISDIDGVLTSLGVTEDSIFETLQHDDWKDSRFDRLCQRELPDD